VESETRQSISYIFFLNRGTSLVTDTLAGAHLKNRPAGVSEETFVRRGRGFVIYLDIWLGVVAG